MPFVFYSVHVHQHEDDVPRESTGKLDIENADLTTISYQQHECRCRRCCWNTIPACQPDRGPSAALYIRQIRWRGDGDD
jgi:hypothetical protein